MSRNCLYASLAILMICSSISAGWADQQNVTATTATRTAALEIKIVMIGFDRTMIDTDYMKWNSPQTRFQLFQIPGLSTNTQYTLSYDYVFLGESFTKDFVTFLKSIAKDEPQQNVIWNISYSKIRTGYYWNYTHFAVRSTNTYYPADTVESWLLEHQSAYGGLPENGYTLLLADLSKHLPSATSNQLDLALHGDDVEFTAHFYNKTYEDSDLGITLNRRFMTAWGGHSRLFFVDLSAGPGEAAEQLPIQLASAANDIDLGTAYGKQWVNQFLADYVSGAVYNIFTPDFVYPINYALSYKIQVIVIDNRTHTSIPPITHTFDQDELVAKLRSLVTWANVSAETQYVRAGDYPELEQVIAEARSPAKYQLPPGSPLVDARPVYEWLSESGQGHIKDFVDVKRDLNEFDIPVFAFAFDGEYEFGFTSKEMVGKQVDFDRTIWGVALYDLVLISHSTEDFMRGDFSEPQQPEKGFGFTNTVIHEVGHMFGLMHPFATLYDPTENFVASVMAYYPYEQEFSIFDRDTLLRGQTDQLLRTTAQLLADTPSVLVNQGALSSAAEKMNIAEQAYSKMNYEDAVMDAFDALGSAASAHAIGGGLIPKAIVTPVEFVISFVLGASIAYVVLRRKRGSITLAPPLQVERTGNCPTCGLPLTWIPEYRRWYCHQCQKYA